MTHYYLYIQAGLKIDAYTQFYKVAIGESNQQQKNMAWLQAYANEHGHFFVLWTSGAVNFLAKCQNSIGIKHPTATAIPSSSLVRVLKKGLEEPATYQAELNRHRQLMQIDPDYYCTHMIISKTLW